MKTTEVNESIIGKRCKCIFTGLMVTGTMEEIKIGKLFYISFVIPNIYIYIDYLLFTSLTVLNLIVICSYFGIFIYNCLPLFTQIE
jgi:hypothetical protein